MRLTGSLVAIILATWTLLAWARITILAKALLAITTEAKPLTCSMHKDNSIHIVSTGHLNKSSGASTALQSAHC